LFKLEDELPTSLAMQCLWPSTKTTSRKALATAAALADAALAGTVLAGVLLAGLSSVLCWSSVASAVTSPSTVTPRRVPLTQVEKQLRRVPAHISEFSPTSEPLALPKCGHVRPPEALLTPDPLLRVQDDDLHLHVRVSFIVGSDGHVHSAFVLDSGGPVEDRIVLRAVRFWRYRPALCNGVPTDSEALVRFSVP
jgi:TonB family protein